MGIYSIDRSVISGMGLSVPKQKDQAKATPVSVGGLLPDQEKRLNERQLSCIVHLHSAMSNVKDVTISVLPDDTLADLKKRLVVESTARCAAEIYAWHTLVLEPAASVAYVVNVAMESGGSNSIGPRIVTLSHLKDVYIMLTGQGKVQGQAERQAGDGTYLTYREAVGVASQTMSGKPLTVPLGVVHEIGKHGSGAGGVPVVMIANPFLAEILVDPLMASQTGDLRDTYHTSTDDDVMTVETLFQSQRVGTGHDAGAGEGAGAIHLDMACVSDVVAHIVAAKPASIPDAWRAGFLRRYFPLRDAWQADQADNSGRAERASEGKAFAATRRAISEVHSVLFNPRHSKIDQCVLSSISIHFGQTVAQSKMSLDQSSGFDVLARIFAKFRVSRDVPVIRYHDGHSASYKVARIALSTKKSEVTEYLARCTRAVITAASASTPSRAQKRPKLDFLVAIGQNDTAMVHIRQDLSYTVVRNFSTSSMNGGGSFENVVEAHSVMNRRVMQQVWTIVSDVGTSSSVVIHETLHNWTDFDQMVGSSQALGTICTVSLPAGKVPTVAKIRDVVERMFPFFVPVTTPGDGNVLFL